MKVPLRVLHVDDNPIDVCLTQAFLAVSGLNAIWSVPMRCRRLRRRFNKVASM